MSEQVSWWSVHEFITAMVDRANAVIPSAGTPGWQDLDDADPLKLLAVAVAGEHHVLRIEIGQDAVDEAGQEISSAEDWRQVAYQIQRRHEIDDIRRSA